MLNKQILSEITEQIRGKSFHKTELYKILRDELTVIGNWKAKPRGKPGVNNFRLIDLGTSNERDGVTVPDWIVRHNEAL